ncbi:MAG: glycosyltransferase [Nitrincola lacisaponensis]|uniref:glycosyltransferase n=1 Tax=Nitrincola lacisaponensis TaxID=267850 RepID=UPI00391B655D
MLSNAGCVIIGRNEGQRLVDCLTSVCQQFAQVVYVDSGSTDQSVSAAESAGALVVQLDMTQPFTAARARNAGLEQLCQAQPELTYVQFIDGDCELVSSWPDQAVAFLEQHADVAIVCGRRRERYPDASVYNRLCDIEWDTPVGEATACGGDALMRIAALQQVSGYNASLIAGEEPEMCHRLRLQGWRIYRLDAEMTLHDAAITRFSQWWKRVSRGGYAFASVSWMYRKSEKIWVREVLRPLFWGIFLSCVLIIGLVIQHPTWIFLPVIMWGVLYIKIAARNVIHMPTPKALQFAFFMLMAKFSEAAGVVKWIFNVLLNRKAKLIEYK